AVNSAGETKASGSQCITTQAGHNTVTMQWDTVQFAASYNIYGRTAGVIGLLTSTANTQFTDNGIAIPGSAPLELSTSGRLDISGSVTVKGTLNIAKTIVPVPATGYGKLYVDNNGELNYMKEDGSAYSLNSISNPNQIIKNFIVESGEQINTGDIVSLANGKIIKGRGIKEYESDICAGCYDTVMEKLTNSSFLIIYRDSLNSYKGTALIATAGTNGFTISAPAVFSAGNIGYVKTVVLSSDKFVVVYYDETNQNSGTVIIGTVSGSTISFGAPVVFNIGYTTYMNIDKLASDKVVISYTDNGNSQYGTAVIGTISGTGISFGSEYIYNNKPTTGASLVVMSADKLIIGFNDRRGYEYIGSVVIASVSGTSLSFDAAKYDFTSDYVSLIDMKKLTSNKFLITYSSNSRSGYGNALVGRLSNTIEYGPNYTFVLDYPYNLAAETFPDDSFVIVFNHQYQGKYQVGLVSGIADNFSISLKPRYLLVPYSSSNINPVYAAGRLAISYKPDSNMIGKITMNNPNKIGYIIGIAKQSGIGGNSIPVVLGGISTEYNNLLPGTVYYTNDNGILTRAVNMNKIGMALSQNELLLDIAR
ncbi:MAG: hypothetical protein HZB65_03755, partial [Candidatus Aenigmarchaeota archaeon]|nr:hypothetical protein [Candidatus Aenigmarchaeota archaeon]